MLKARARLNRETFTRVLKRGALRHSAHFSLKRYIERTGTPERFSVVIPKRVAKTAVGRHTLKRRLYSAIRDLMSRIPKHTQGIIYVKSGAPKLSYQALLSELRELLS